MNIRNLICLITSFVLLSFVFVSKVWAEKVPIRIPHLGVGVHAHSPRDMLVWYDYEQLGISWFFDWGYGRYDEISAVEIPEAMEFVSMFWGGSCGQFEANYISAHPENYPSGTTFMLGNEIANGNGNLSAESYAVNYHYCYQLLKGINSTYKLATVASPSYWRYIDYIESFRRAYQQQYGEYPDIGAYRLNVYDGFRHLEDWSMRLREKMKSWGDQNKDLIITESCVRDGTVEKNITYLNQALDYVTNRTDPDLGKPDDGYHMVQKFAWFSLNAGTYSTCPLFDPEQHWEPYPPVRSRLTAVGQTWVNWVADHPQYPSCQIDLKVAFEGLDGQADVEDVLVMLEDRQRTVTLSQEDDHFQKVLDFEDLLTGTYQVKVKGPYHLSQETFVEVILGGTASLDFTVLGSQSTGDLDGDDDVDMRDVGIFISNYGEQNSVGDLNFDGVVDLSDMGYLIANYTGS